MSGDRGTHRKKNRRKFFERRLMILRASMLFGGFLQNRLALRDQWLNSIVTSIVFRLCWKSASFPIRSHVKYSHFILWYNLATSVISYWASTSEMNFLHCREESSVGSLEYIFLDRILRIYKTNTCKCELRRYQMDPKASVMQSEDFHRQCQKLIIAGASL